MVMPRRMGEGGREKKGNGEGSARSGEQGACGAEDEAQSAGCQGPHAECGLGRSLLTARLLRGPAKVRQLVKVHQQWVYLAVVLEPTLLFRLSSSFMSV